MPEENDTFDFPPKLGEAIRQAYTHRLTVPEETSRFILSAARARFARRQRMRIVMRWGGGIAAAVAAVIVVAVVLHRPVEVRAVAKGDINGDGQKNIVDAMVLAKHLAGHDPVDKAWDVNGDGVVDQKDVDALAMAAVSLKQGGVAVKKLPGLEELGIGKSGALAKREVMSSVGFALANGRAEKSEDPKNIANGKQLGGREGFQGQTRMSAPPVAVNFGTGSGKHVSSNELNTKTFAKANPTTSGEGR